MCMYDVYMAFLFCPSMMMGLGPMALSVVVVMACSDFFDDDVLLLKTV